MIDNNHTGPKHHGHWIGGAEVETGGERIVSTRPGTQDVVCTIAAGNEAIVDRAVEDARTAWPQWRDRSPAERGRILADVAVALRESIDLLAGYEAAETGKPSAHTPREVQAAISYFDFYAGLVHLPSGELFDLGASVHSYVRREPYGVVAIITPWNAPLGQATRGVAPALAAGNTVVIKPSEFTSASTLEMARIMVEAGLPAGVCNVVTGTGQDAGRPLVSHELVRKVAFTGSLRIGREIGRTAGQRIIPATLELGGKSPNLVFADADIDAAVAGVVKAFTTNAGQHCAGGTRLLVDADIHDEFVARLVAATAAITPGVHYGSQTTEAQFAKVRRYIQTAEDEGARLVCGGGSTTEGWYVEPTIFTDVTVGMKIAQEEVFGPVLAVLRFGDEAEALRIANGTEYGLAAGVWTKDLSRAHRIAAQLEAGQVYVNEWNASRMEGPFGGYKNSGIGREKGVEALHHYTQTKFVTVTI
ncbi:aldehyde dehydrogenase family protein [Nocardia jiangxiensis]|uniref:Aldehyde dehydrogenase family protein n=1 Tax=Nocardia jiangxiensis TaxID=282685 RepID=A0ABW6SAL3_9NOCA|nr:aldehyde dehydrogenase family protein [Nocardia jiangxiensis]